VTSMQNARLYINIVNQELLRVAGFYLCFTSKLHCALTHAAHHSCVQFEGVHHVLSIAAALFWTPILWCVHVHRVCT
jgi:hypothetical protein